MNELPETALDALGAAEPSPAISRVLLIVERASADATSDVIELGEGAELHIGRVAGTHTLAIDDPRVSRQHARVWLEAGVLSVEDLGGRNGTLVNDRLLMKGRLRVEGGDCIKIANVTITVGAFRAREVAADVTFESQGEVTPGAGVIVAEASMKQVFALAHRLAHLPTTVLLLGESGAGKQIVAEAIARGGPRHAAPFIRVNCAALPEQLVESALFGHEKGAFTGADRRHIGFFEAAGSGTLFLDEVGELPPPAQAKLLTALESHVIIRVGDTREIPVLARVVAATNRDLWQEVKAGRFREDLFFRLSAFTLEVPPLRTRPQEVRLLAEVFVKQLAKAAATPAPVIAPDAHALLRSHFWPGNVRELRNAMEYAFVVASEGVIHAHHLPTSVSSKAQGVPNPSASASALPDSMDDLERRSVEAAMTTERGNQTRAALRLGISRRALIHKLDKHGISRRHGAPP
ncbi:MAG: sigma 54-interacting transcriptional regulator [Deltaproteobacteria bacterium]|nr:sigma 54-interacting transcriptional regulator [Deltaproteobacteria bacterium]